MAGRPTVLLIDDHEFFRSCVSVLLESAGFEVVGSCPGVQAGLEVLRAERPDLVLIDLDMPQIDGVLGTALILAESPSTPVLMLTGTPTHTRHRAALEAGVRAVLTKDDPATVLLEALHGALAAAPAA